MANTVVHFDSDWDESDDEVGAGISKVGDDGVVEAAATAISLQVELDTNNSVDVDGEGKIGGSIATGTRRRDSQTGAVQTPQRQANRINGRAQTCTNDNTGVVDGTIIDGTDGAKGPSTVEHERCAQACASSAGAHSGISIPRSDGHADAPETTGDDDGHRTRATTATRRRTLKRRVGLQQPEAETSAKQVVENMLPSSESMLSHDTGIHRVNDTQERQQQKQQHDHLQQQRQQQRQTSIGDRSDNEADYAFSSPTNMTTLLSVIRQEDAAKSDRLDAVETCMARDGWEERAATIARSSRCTRSDESKGHIRGRIRVAFAAASTKQPNTPSQDGQGLSEPLVDIGSNSGPTPYSMNSGKGSRGGTLQGSPDIEKSTLSRSKSQQRRTRPPPTLHPDDDSNPTLRRVDVVDQAITSLGLAETVEGALRPGNDPAAITSTTDLLISEHEGEVENASAAVSWSLTIRDCQLSSLLPVAGLLHYLSDLRNLEIRGCSKLALTGLERVLDDALCLRVLVLRRCGISELPLIASGSIEVGSAVLAAWHHTMIVGSTISFSQDRFWAKLIFCFQWLDRAI